MRRRSTELIHDAEQRAETSKTSAYGQRLVRNAITRLGSRRSTPHSTVIGAGASRGALGASQHRALLEASGHTAISALSLAESFSI